MINQPSESFDYYPTNTVTYPPIGPSFPSVTSMSVANPRHSGREIATTGIITSTPIFTTTIGQGMQRIVHPQWVEFTEDIVCQKLSIRCINANINEFIFELIDHAGTAMDVKNGSTVTLRRVTYFRETHYRLVAHYTNADGDATTIEVMHVTISWPSRRYQPSVRTDLVSLLAIQGDEDIHLPPRSFWSYWARVGDGISAELEAYRENGCLPAIPSYYLPNQLTGLSLCRQRVFPGIRAILESGTDEQIGIVISHILSSDDVTPTKYRQLISRGLAERTPIDIAALVKDMNILYGYEYHVDVGMLIYFR